MYDNGFTGRMKENPAYETWQRQAYLKRYPSPPRNNSPLPENTFRENGFAEIRWEPYSNEVSMSSQDLVNYLLTQSNVIAAVEQGSESIEDVGIWIYSSVKPFFLTPHGTFEFVGSILFLKKTAAPSD